MIRSLYTRVVLIYLSAVIVGTLISFFVATMLFGEELMEYAQLPMQNLAQDIQGVYELLPVEEADEIVGRLNQLKSYHVRIYSQADQFRSYGETNGYMPVTITMEQVMRVLSGETVKVVPSGASVTLLGVPFTTQTGAKAMFLEPVIDPVNPFAFKWILSFLAYSLIIGSILMLFAAVFLVKPLKKLTRATKHIAGGDFNVKLNIRQSGELGNLVRGFEEMMRDLQQLEQMRKDFVSNVSHEIQSPLTSVSGYARALKQVNLSEEQRGRYLDIIISEADRLSNMSAGLLKLSQLESQSHQLELTEFSLDEQIRRVIVAIQPQWSPRGIRFDLQLKTVRIKADSDLLSQVWTNIIGNSIKFSPDASVISVSILQDARHAIVRIADTGIGISPEDQTRVFERFFKADRAHSRRYSGSGMGLSIVKQIVTLHHGDIQVDSKLGEGTAITVTMPLVVE